MNTNSKQHLVHLPTHARMFFIWSAYQDYYWEYTCFWKCRCGLRRQSTMSLVLQLYTGNASKCSRTAWCPRLAIQ